MYYCCNNQLQTTSQSSNLSNIINNENSFSLTQNQNQLTNDYNIFEQTQNINQYQSNRTFNASLKSMNMPNSMQKKENRYQLQKQDESVLSKFSDETIKTMKNQLKHTQRTKQRSRMKSKGDKQNQEQEQSEEMKKYFDKYFQDNKNEIQSSHKDEINENHNESLEELVTVSENGILLESKLTSNQNSMKKKSSSNSPLKFDNQQFVTFKGSTQVNDDILESINEDADIYEEEISQGRSINIMSQNQRVGQAGEAKIEMQIEHYVNLINDVIKNIHDLEQSKQSLISIKNT